GIDEKYVPKEVSDGIFVLPEDTVIGEDIELLLNLNDAILEFDLTPNRADCLSMLGIGYEVAAILDEDVNMPDESIETIDERVEDYITLDVENPELNPYYGAFLLKSVNIKPSPICLRNYLMTVIVRHV